VYTCYCARETEICHIWKERLRSGIGREHPTCLPSSFSKDILLSLTRDRFPGRACLPSVSKHRRVPMYKTENPSFTVTLTDYEFDTSRSTAFQTFTICSISSLAGSGSHCPCMQLQMTFGAGAGLWWPWRFSSWFSHDYFSCPVCGISPFLS
jgi:hypothetical protein